MQAPGVVDWSRRNWGYLVAAAMAIAVYLPAVAGEPIWDDEIVFARYLPTFRSLGDAFVPPAGAGELGQYYYRPFVTLSYLFDNWLYGEQSHYGHHLTVILFHVLTVLGVGVLTRRLMPELPSGQWAAIAAAGWFAVHPVHVDSVAQISGRSDVMAAGFMVWSVLLTMSGRWPLAGALFLAGLFCKEVAVVTIVLAAALMWWQRASKVAWGRFAIWFGVASVMYGILRFNADPGSAPFAGSSPGEALSRLLRAIGYYAEMATVPTTQAAFVPFERTPPAWVGAVPTLMLTAAGVACWRFRSTPKVLRLAWVWLVVALLPSLALLFVSASEQSVAERYLYVPSIGVALAAGWLVARLAALPRGGRPTAIVFGLVLALGAAVTASRASIYVDNRTFWEDTANKAPQAALPKYQLGLTLRKAGELDEAEKWLEWALERYDDAEGRSLAQNTLGTIHLERSEWDDAERRFWAALAERPEYAVAWFNLGSTYGMRADSKRGPRNAPDLADAERCLQALDKAVALRPNYKKARTALARQALQMTKIYLAHGRSAEARGMAPRVRAAAEWLIGSDPRGPGGQFGRSVLAELARLPL